MDQFSRYYIHYLRIHYLNIVLLLQLLLLDSHTRALIWLFKFNTLNYDRVYIFL